MNNYRTLIIKVCNTLNFKWINESTWKYRGYHNKNIVLSIKRHNWEIETISIFSIDNLKKIHGTENLYYHESEVKRYIRYFCKHNNLCWINSKNWKFTNRKDENIKIMCHVCGSRFNLSFRQLLDRKVGCMECFKRKLRTDINEINFLIRKAEKELSCECLNKNEKYINRKETKFKFLINLELYKKVSLIWETNLDTLEIILKNRKSSVNKFYIFLKKDQLKNLLKEFIKDTGLTINYEGELRSNTILECCCPICGEKENIKTIDLLYGKRKFKCRCNGLYYSGEIAIKDFLKKNNIVFEIQKTFSWLRYKNNLKIDFYLPEYNIGIEYQGEQHFVPIKYFGGQETFELITDRDKTKNKLCSDNGIKLLYVSNKIIYDRFSSSYPLGKLIYDFDELLKEIKKKYLKPLKINTKKMTIIHPNDRSTEFLKVLYDKPKPDLTEENSKREVNHLLNISKEVMILGHGTEYGLLCKKGENMFGRYLVDYSHRYYLSKCNKIIGIWCNANIYAEKLGLHGLFSGMVISELSEAEDWGIKTTQEELNLENKKFALRLSELIKNPEIKLYEIPDIFQTLDDSKTPLTKFNYESIYWI